MSIAVLEIRRVFRYNGILLPDVPGLEPREVRDLYSAQYPELVSAEIEPGEVHDGVQEFSFRKAVGTKGVGRPAGAPVADGGEVGPRLAALLATIQANETSGAGKHAKLRAALDSAPVRARSAAVSRFAQVTLAQPRRQARAHRLAATSDMLAPVA